VNHDSGNGDAGFLVLDSLFISLFIGETVVQCLLAEQDPHGVSSCWTL